MRGSIILANTLLAICFISSCQKEVLISSISLSETIISLTEGESKTIIASITPDNATNQQLIWKSSNPAVAIVEGGKITAIKEGSATITVESNDGSKSAKCSVNVQAKYIAVNSISFNQDTLSMYDDETVTLTYTINPSNASNQSVIWDSSDNTVATVVYGQVKALREGTTTITASIENVSATCVITVNKRIIHVESISLSTNEKRLKVGESFVIDCSVNPNNANNYILTYSSDNESIASVNNDGVITANSSGKTIIRVTAEDKSEELQINVFVSDNIIFSYYDGNHTNKVFKNDDIIEETTTQLYLIATYEDGSTISYSSETINYTQRPFIINKGVRYYFNNIDYTKTHFISCCEYANNTIYSVINYPLPKTNGGFGLWMGLDKVYDIADDGPLSDYSTLSILDMTVIGPDVYVCGVIYEPIDAQNRKSYPVIWKNGSIYKKYESESGKQIEQMINVDGKLYFLMNEPVFSEKISYYSIWDENGKCYDLCKSSYCALAKIYCFNSTIFAAIGNSDDNYKQMASIYKGKDLMYTIEDADDFYLDYIDGDIYCILRKLIWLGGQTYYSLHLYRNNVEERQYVKAQTYPMYVGGIKVFPNN